MFALTGLLQLCFARGLHRPQGDRFKYLEPRFKLAVTVLMGASERPRLAQAAVCASGRAGVSSRGSDTARRTHVPRPVAGHGRPSRASTGRPRASTLSFCRFPRPPGLLQIARLRFTSKLVTYRTQGVILMDVLEGAALLLYVAYIVWRYTSAQYRLQPLVALQVRVKGGESGRGLGGASAWWRGVACTPQICWSVPWSLATRSRPSVSPRYFPY